MHDSSECPICRGLPIGDSITDEQFLVLLDACRAELAKKQARFQQCISGVECWRYDLTNCSLAIDHEHFDITPIGTHSVEHQTWLWAWANDDFPTVAREASRLLQTLYTLTGFKVFLDPGITASAADADDFAALAVHQLDAVSVFKSTSNNTTLYLAVHSNNRR